MIIIYFDKDGKRQFCFNVKHIENIGNGSVEIISRDSGTFTLSWNMIESVVANPVH